MATRPVHPSTDRAAFPRVSMLGIIFFLLGVGAPLPPARHRLESQEQPTFPRYVMLVLFAGAIASALEMTMF